MSESKFKTMRHIETVRNYLQAAQRELMWRSQNHDQSKLESPEVEIFEIYTSKLRGTTYGSDEYKKHMKEMKVAIDHHNSVNRHHPEYFENGLEEMNLFDLMEMIIDWRCAGLRHADGDILKSLEINKKRFGMSDELHDILLRTIKYLEKKHHIYHKADES